jgi:hypothetical protein
MRTSDLIILNVPQTTFCSSRLSVEVTSIESLEGYLISSLSKSLSLARGLFPSSGQPVNRYCRVNFELRDESLLMVLSTPGRLSPLPQVWNPILHQ